MVPALRYDKLDIQEGGTASFTYSQTEISGCYNTGYTKKTIV